MANRLAAAPTAEDLFRHEFGGLEWSDERWQLDQAVMDAESANRAENQIARLRTLRDSIDELLAARATLATQARTLDALKRVADEWQYNEKLSSLVFGVAAIGMTAYFGLAALYVPNLRESGLCVALMVLWLLIAFRCVRDWRASNA
jgi:DUF438 domain-containing protein